MKIYWIILACLASCAHAPPVATRIVPGPCVEPEPVLCAASPLREEKPAPRLQLAPIPAAPSVVWVDKDCPKRYLACLTGADAIAVREYLEALRAWATTVEGKVKAHGQR